MLDGAPKGDGEAPPELVVGFHRFGMAEIVRLTAGPATRPKL
jgi:hypothetical protein